MDRPADYSSAIARIQVWRSVLHYLEPDGKWSQAPLLQQWGQVRHALTIEQLAALHNALEAAYEAALERYQQRRLAGHKKDSKRVQLELPGVRYGS